MEEVVVEVGVVLEAEAELADDSAPVEKRLLSWMRAMARSSSMAWKCLCFRLLNSTKVDSKPARVKETDAINVTAFYE